MSDNIVDATALSRYYNTFQASLLKIGDEWVRSSLESKYDDPWNWYVVVSLTDLSVVANEASESKDQVPASILAYQGKDGFFLFFITNAARGYTVPQGQVYDFLTQVGADFQLRALEQLIDQLGTGTITFTSYILGATTDSNDLPGFEVMSTNHNVNLPMQFKEIFDTDGNSLGYAPVIKY